MHIRPIPVPAVQNAQPQLVQPEPVAEDKMYVLDK